MNFPLRPGGSQADLWGHSPKLVAIVTSAHCSRSLGPCVAPGAAGAAAAARVCGRVHGGKLLPSHRGPADRPRAQAERELHLWPEGARTLLHRRPPGGELIQTGSAPYHLVSVVFSLHFSSKIYLGLSLFDYSALASAAFLRLHFCYFTLTCSRATVYLFSIPHYHCPPSPPP